MRVRGSGTVCKYNLGMSGEIRIVNSVHRNAESLDRFTHNMTDSEHNKVSARVNKAMADC